MSPVGEAKKLARKNTGFSINSDHKKAAVIVSNFGRGVFNYDG